MSGSAPSAVRAAGERDRRRAQARRGDPPRAAERSGERSGRRVEIESDVERLLVAADQRDASPFDDEAVKRDAASGDLKAPARQIDGAVRAADERQGGMIDPGKGKTHAAARQAGERHLELERLAHQSGGAAGGGGDRHVLEQEIRRRKESDVDRAGDDDRRADDRAELRLDLPAMARPINEQRRD